MIIQDVSGKNSAIGLSFLVSLGQGQGHMIKTCNVTKATHMLNMKDITLKLWANALTDRQPQNNMLLVIEFERYKF